MARTAKQLGEEGVRSAVVDLSQLGSRRETEAESWYSGLIFDLAAQFGLRKHEVQSWWQEHRALPVAQRLIEYFRSEVLEAILGRVVIFFDEVDSLIGMPFSDDFFAAMRSCFNARATDDRLSRLTFVVLGVATPSQLIRDPVRTPFNVGYEISLNDFSLDEARALKPGLGSDDSQAESVLNRILYWTAGHPYLTQALCASVAEHLNQGTLDAALVDRTVERVFFGRDRSNANSNIKYVGDRLTIGPSAREVLRLYRRVREGAAVLDQPAVSTFALLKLTGVVAVDVSGALRVRNRIYERLFSVAWVLAETPRERWIASFGIGVAVTIAVSFLSFFTAIRPDGQALAELRATSDETLALANYERLTSARFARNIGVLFGAGQANVDRAIAEFWQRRAQAFEDRSLSRAGAGMVEEACLLAVAASVKRNGPVSESGRIACNDRRIAPVSLAVTALYPNAGSFRGGIEPEFANDGKSLIVGAWLERTPVHVIDLSSGRSVWSHTYDGKAVILADARTIVEIDSSKARVFDRDQLVEEIQMAADLKVAASYQGRSTLVPIGSTQDPGSAPASTLKKISACLARVPTEERNHLTSFGVSRDGTRAGLVNSLRLVYQCDLRTGVVRTLLSTKGGEVSGFGTLEYSPDGRILTTVVEQPPATGKLSWHAVAIDASSGALLREWNWREWDQRFSIDGTYLVFFSQILKVRDWSLAFSAPKGSQILALSPSSQLVALGFSKMLRIVEMQSGALRFEYPLESGDAPFRVAFSKDEKSLVLGGESLRVISLLDSKDETAIADPLQRWQRFQLKLGLTLDASDEVVSLWRTGPTSIRRTTTSAAPSPRASVRVQTAGLRQ